MSQYNLLKISIGVLVLTTLLGACATANGAPGRAAAEANATDSGVTLSAYNWQLLEAKNVKGQRLSAVLTGTPPVQLHFQNDHLRLEGGCNVLSAAYQAGANNMHTQALVSTRKACAETLMARDQALAHFFANSTLDWAVSGSAAAPMLVLRNADGSRLLWQGMPTPETRYGSTATTIFMEIAPQTKPCYGAHGQQSCLNVRDIRYDEQGRKTHIGDWQMFSDSIEGYQHHSHTRQIVRVKRYTRPQPAADQSAYAYVLDMVVETESVDPAR